MFAAILRKSTYNLEQCSKNEFIMKIIALLPNTRDVVAELLGDILSVLAQYNLSVDELKALMKQLRSIDKGEGRHTWNHNSLKLIEVLTSQRFITCIFKLQSFAFNFASFCQMKIGEFSTILKSRAQCCQYPRSGCVLSVSGQIVCRHCLAADEAVADSKRLFSLGLVSSWPTQQLAHWNWQALPLLSANFKGHRIFRSFCRRMFGDHSIEIEGKRYSPRTSIARNIG